MTDFHSNPGQPEETLISFEDFVGRDLKFDGAFGLPSWIPPEVLAAAWQRFLDRLARQTQAFADDPQVDIWEELLSDEHRAIVAAVDQAFMPLSQPYLAKGMSAAEWHYWLRCVAVLTLHIETNRSARVLEPEDIIPYLDCVPYGEGADDEEDEGPSERDAAFMAKHSIRPGAALPAKRRVVTWSNTEVLVLTSLFWLLVATLARYFGL